MTATDRFKAMLAHALERLCVLEEQLELAQSGSPTSLDGRTM